MLGDVLAYLTDGDNWSGPTGIGTFLVQQLLLTVTALVVAMVLGLPLALWAGHRSRGGFLAINVSNVGRAVPVFAVLLVLSLGPDRLRGVRPLRPRRPGHLDRAGPVRAPAADHQRLRRDHRGRPRHRRGLARAWAWARARCSRPSSSRSRCR